MNGVEALWTSVSAPGSITTMRVGCSLVFGYAGVLKLVNPTHVTKAAAAIGLVRPPNRWFGRTIGTWELSLALLIVNPQTVRAAGLLVGVTAMTFFVFLRIVLRRGVSVPCACFGFDNEPASRNDVVRAQAISLVALLVCVAPQRSFVNPPWLVASCVASCGLATPLLIGSWKRLEALGRTLDQKLDWDWILQHDDSFLVASAIDKIAVER